jgi:hypothetical protein
MGLDLHQYCPIDGKRFNPQMAGNTDLPRHAGREADQFPPSTGGKVKWDRPLVERSGMLLHSDRRLEDERFKPDWAGTVRRDRP